MLRRSVPILAMSSMRATILDRSCRWTSWYPAQGGRLIGNALAGHNLFIRDIPQKFSPDHAKHFALLESASITPLYTLSIVHYFSVFGQYPGRVTVLVPLMRQLCDKATAQHAWLHTVAQRSPIDALSWRAGLLALQLVLFPFWLMLSAAAPQLVHSSMQHVDHILYVKYTAVSQGAPAFVPERITHCLKSQDFHEQQSRLATDLAVTTLVVFLVIYLIW